MKRVKHLWPIITDPENGVRAIIDGTRYKRGHRETHFLLYTQEEIRQDPTLRGRIDERKARAYAEQIIAKLQSGAWHHQLPKHRRQFCRSRASSKGKWRDLYIPQLKDHIVSHMVMNAAIQAFMRGMHPHCCGSIPGRGIAHLNRTVKRWMRQDKACRYFAKVDIRRFFDNIDRDRLMDVLRSKIGDPKALEIFREIIDSAPVPCPVGYYTSPWLANLYLEKLDWYVEQHLYKERRGGTDQVRAALSPVHGRHPADRDVEGGSEEGDPRDPGLPPEGARPCYQAIVGDQDDREARDGGW